MTGLSPDEANISEKEADALDSIAVRISKEEILRARRKALAKRQNYKTSEESLEIVEFLLADESYGFEVLYLREVCQPFDVTYVPGSPPFVLGVINIRGQIIPLLDLMAFLEVKDDIDPTPGKAIILQKGKFVVAFRADVVIGAVKVPLNGLQTSMPGLGSVSSEYLRGVTQERLIVLDAKKILDDPRLNGATIRNKQVLI